MWVNQCHLHHPPVITIFRGGMVTIPNQGWFMALFYPRQMIFPARNLHFKGLNIPLPRFNTGG